VLKDSGSFPHSLNSQYLSNQSHKEDIEVGMRFPKTASLSAISVLVSVTAFSAIAPVKAEEKPKFTCGMSNGVPATLALTSEGYSPLYRCQVVSPKFEKYHKQGILNYLTTGVHSGNNIVCVAKEKDGPCVGVLFTLKPGSDSFVTLKRLLDVRSQAGPALNESTGSAQTSADSGQSIDFQAFLNSVPVDPGATPLGGTTNAAPVTAPAAPSPATDAAPAAPAPAPSGGLW
jgi:hypothetical protein